MRRRLSLTFSLLAAGLGWLSSTPPAVAATGNDTVRLHYMQYCAGCHLSDGTGSPARGVPSMRGGVLGQFMGSEAGRSYLLRVPGVTNTPLNDAQTAELMNWVLARFGDGSLPGHTPAFTADEAKAGRVQRLSDPQKLRASLLAQPPGAASSSPM
jgi:mono/diheme cytochrome c family protein